MEEDKNNKVVVGGHQRLKVLKELGYNDIDVVFVDLNNNEEKALNVALNKISGDFDAEKLEDILRDLKLDTDFDIELTGFTDDEIETLFNGSLDNNDNDINKKNKQERENELNKLCEEANKILDNPRDIKFGDVYKLGNHKLLCGDSYNEDTFKKLINNKVIDCVFTDPPYNYDGLDKERSNNSKYIKRLKDIHADGFDTLDINKIEYLFKHDIKSLYICCNINDLYDWLSVAKKYNYKYRVQVWCKTSSVPVHNNNYLNNLEYIVYFRKHGAIFNNDCDFYYYSQCNYDNKLNLTEEQIKHNWYSEYSYISTSEVSYNNNKENISHPTSKPLKLILPKIAISSNEGGIVVDMFGGSGSTLIACEKINRTCYMVEYLPKYCNEIINRWEALTGLKAEYINNIFDNKDGDTDGNESKK